MHPVCNESEAAKNIDFWGHKWHQDRRKTETGASFIDVPGFWSTTSDAGFYGQKRIADVKSQQIPSERPENGRSYFTFLGASTQNTLICKQAVLLRNLNQFKLLQALIHVSRYVAKFPFTSTFGSCGEPPSITCPGINMKPVQMQGKRSLCLYPVEKVVKPCGLHQRLALLLRSSGVTQKTQAPNSFYGTTSYISSCFAVTAFPMARSFWLCSSIGPSLWNCWEEQLQGAAQQHKVPRRQRYRYIW